MKVLIADDDKGNQKLFPLFLQRMGFQTKVVPNGEDAVEAAKESSFELILMDINMPLMNGYEAAIAIRKAEHGRSAYIVALTADYRESTVATCNAAGMDEVVTKPIMYDEMERMIGRLFGPIS